MKRRRRRRRQRPAQERKKKKGGNIPMTAPKKKNELAKLPMCTFLYIK